MKFRFVFQGNIYYVYWCACIEDDDDVFLKALAAARAPEVDASERAAATGREEPSWSARHEVYAAIRRALVRLPPEDLWRLYVCEPDTRLKAHLLPSLGEPWLLALGAGLIGTGDDEARIAALIALGASEPRASTEILELYLASPAARTRMLAAVALLYVGPGALSEGGRAALAGLDSLESDPLARAFLASIAARMTPRG
jgi:hypothetical protein